MADCENLVSCPFFDKQIAAMPGIIAMYKRKYCKGDNSKCARYMVYRALGKELVPLDLVPNMTDRAKKIIEENK